jgi:hypothetical protein
MGLDRKRRALGALLVLVWNRLLVRARASEVVSHIYGLRKDELAAAAGSAAEDQRKRDADAAEDRRKVEVDGLQQKLSEAGSKSLNLSAFAPLAI